MWGDMKTVIRLNRRRLKVLGEASGVYHCMTRVVAGEHLLGSREREVLRKQLHRQAEFCGVQVLTYCIMSNHFHVLVRVPPEGETRGVSDEELVRRVHALYPRDKALVWESRLRGEEREAVRERLLARMGDVSQFMRELKHRFSLWYNRSRGRYGTLWAERFKSVLVSPDRTSLLAVSCYIDLNPVRAGLCQDPKDYRWCGYGEACGGSEVSRSGLRRVLEATDWRACQKTYRVHLFGRANAALQGEGRGLPEASVARVKGREGDLSLSEVLRCRVRYFTAGAAIGTREFVEEVLRENSGMFGKSRKSGPVRMRGKGLREFYSLRNLQKDVFG